MSYVSVLFSEPKIPQTSARALLTSAISVSVLFSEPKIPQNDPSSSRDTVRTRFQCSSASRKFLKRRPLLAPKRVGGGFSALQRAENSSKLREPALFATAGQFQCSSASRKFLKAAKFNETFLRGEFQCSSASRKFLKTACRSSAWRSTSVSVLFSEPKIPQTVRVLGRDATFLSFSALQRAENSSNALVVYYVLHHSEFQCSSASRKFLKQNQ